MISAPNVKAVGDRSDANTFINTLSLLLVPKKMYLGKMKKFNATGPHMAASLELEKKTLMRKAREISLMVNRKK